MLHLLLTFLISSQLLQYTYGEWVEISQQHYRRKPEDFFDTATNKAPVTGVDLSTSIKTPILEIDKDVGARIKGAVLSVSNGVVDSRPKKGNVYRITNLGGKEKGLIKINNFKDIDELNFSSEDKKVASVSDLRKGEIDKTSVVRVRKPLQSSDGSRKPNPIAKNRFGSKGHSSISPGGNKIVRLTNTNAHTNNVQSSEKVIIKNDEIIKTSSPSKNQHRKPAQDSSGQRYESYEIKDDESNKYVIKNKGAHAEPVDIIKTNDKIVLHNLNDIMPQLTTQTTVKPATSTLEDVFNMETAEYPYIDVVHDFDEIPNRKVDLIDGDTYKVEADEISDVKLIVRKPTRNHKQENTRISNIKQTQVPTAMKNDKSFSKKQQVDSYENSNPKNHSEHVLSSEIKNDKIPFERLDVTKIAEPPDPGFITKHDIIEEGFIIDDNSSGSISQESSESIGESETFIDDATVTTEKTDSESVQDTGTSINSTKLNPIENVMKVVKYVAETISNNTRKGLKSKINYLNRLKSSLMNNIVSRIDALWPDDDERSHRTARKARSHVEFPSSEGALMSISFLTFAVFLIKLVMQLIQTFRNNNNQFIAPAGAVLVGRAAAAISKRSGRLTGN